MAGTWEPLADRIPVDMRRLATQLRRMKDRSGLTVPALAARTAHSVEGWERAFAARQLPPLDAVEVLAQASGADYDRVGALWKLAQRASTGGGDRGRGRPVPHPDPLDPLGAEEGLPGRGRRVLLLLAVAALAAAALVGVMLTARTGGGAPDGSARPTMDASSVPERFASPASGGGGTAAGGAGSAPGTSSGAAGGVPAAGDTPSAMGSAVPAATPDAASTAPPSAASTTAPAGPAGTTPPPTTSAPPATPSQLCLGLILLGVCIG